MYLLDANILRYFFAGHPILDEHLRRVPETELAVASVTVAEVLRGRCDNALKATPEQLPLAHRLLIESQQSLKRFQVIVFDQICSARLIQLKKQHKNHKRYPDLMIAATALALNHIVVTRNTRHFADLLPANRMANWIDDPPR